MLLEVHPRFETRSYATLRIALAFLARDVRSYGTINELQGIHLATAALNVRRSSGPDQTMHVRVASVLEFHPDERIVERTEGLRLLGLTGAT